jgi:hypothetical protein
MPHSDFAPGLEAELHLRGLFFSRAEVLAFADNVWQLAQEAPDPVRWADAFVEAGYAGARRCTANRDP